MLACQVIARRFNLSAEFSRKMVHVGMGVICACFPLMFNERWPVYALAGLATLSLLIIRLTPRLKRSVGESLHGVDRFSLGEIYFPLGIGILWFISLNNTLFFSISTLVLSLADASAAIVGTRFGSKLVSTIDGAKSWEGNLAFFVVASCCIGIPLFIFTDTPPLQLITVAILIGILMMLVETISWHGLDNLFIPLATFVMLDAYTDMAIQSLYFRIAIIAALILVVWLARNSMSIDDASVLSIALFLYLSYMIGGIPWLLPPLILIINYLWIVRRNPKEETRVHTIYAIAAVCGPPFFWMMIQHRFDADSYLLPYAMTFICSLSFMNTAHGAYIQPQRPMLATATLGTLIPILLILLPQHIWLMESSLLAGLLTPSLLALASGLLFVKWQPEIKNCPIDKARWIRHGLLSFASSMMIYIIQNQPGH